MSALTAGQRKMAMRILALRWTQLENLVEIADHYDWLPKEAEDEREECVVKIAKILFPELRKRTKA